MAERKPYTTKTRQIILEDLKRQPAVTGRVSDIEEYLKDEGRFRLQCSGDMLHGICQDCEEKETSSQS